MKGCSDRKVICGSQCMMKPLQSGDGGSWLSGMPSFGQRVAIHLGFFALLQPPCRSREDIHLSSVDTDYTGTLPHMMLSPLTFTSC